MPTTDDLPDQHDDVDVLPWAQRFAERRRHLHDDSTVHTTELWTVRAIETLWRLVDSVIDEANRALEETGASERILVERTSRQYRLGMPGPDDGERQITVFASVHALGTQVSGGAHITNSETRATIHLEPTVHSTHVRWMVPAAGKEFTARVLNDLFLSVFSDDPVATKRISLYYTAVP